MGSTNIYLFDPRLLIKQVGLLQKWAGNRRLYMACFAQAEALSREVQANQILFSIILFATFILSSSYSLCILSTRKLSKALLVKQNFS